MGGAFALVELNRTLYSSSLRDCLERQLTGEPERFLIQRLSIFEARSIATDRESGW